MIVDRAHGAPMGGQLLYSKSEYSFRYRPDEDELGRRIGTEGSTSIAVGTLQIQVDVSSRQLLFVWGYHPNPAWQPAELAMPAADPGRLEVPEGIRLESGVAYRLAGIGEWKTSVDPQSGLVRIARTPDRDEDFTMFAESITAGRVDGELHSLWLRPDMID
ncbi:hypothetical protein AB0C76_26180 [Kitasatospora sp. NPDC048722]|uniref:hypothetical protein n=1 Tax=Kitasatospora sp. NPDC048722 TaxID=3155639 RepID=UPI0033D898BA